MGVADGHDSLGGVQRPLQALRHEAHLLPEAHQPVPHACTALNSQATCVTPTVQCSRARVRLLLR